MRLGHERWPSIVKQGRATEIRRRYAGDTPEIRRITAAHSRPRQSLSKSRLLRDAVSTRRRGGVCGDVGSSLALQTCPAAGRPAAELRSSLPLTPPRLTPRRAYPSSETAACGRRVSP